MMELEQPATFEEIKSVPHSSTSTTQPDRAQLDQQRSEDLQNDTHQSNQQEKIQTQKPKKMKKIDKKSQKKRKDRKKEVLLKRIAQCCSSTNPPKIQNTAQQSRQIPILSPTENVEMHSLENFHQEIDRIYYGPVTHQHFQRLKQRAESKYMHISDLLNAISGKIKVSQPHINKYTRLLREIKRDKDDELALLYQNKDRYAVLFYEMGKSQEENVEEPTLQMKSHMELSHPQFALLKMRHIYMTSLHNKLKSFNENRETKTNLDEISKETLFFRNLLELESRKINKQVEILQKKAQLLDQDNQKFQKLLECQNEYISIILNKNLRMSFAEQHIDLVNYFKMRSCFEQRKQFEPFTSVKDSNDYIKKKMIKKTKKTKNPLCTACKGCLSNYYEQYNPFRNCYECGSRFHRLCLSISNNICTVCQGKKLKKTFTAQCCLCPQRGFMYKTLSNGTNVHVWCALAFNQFKVKNKTIQILTPNLSMKDDSQSCFLCQKTSGRLIPCSCSTNCHRSAHPMCAYLHGHHLSKPSSCNPIQFNCQLNSSQLTEQGYYRCYILNHNKIAYKFYSVEDYKKSRQKSVKNCMSVAVSEEIEVEDERGRETPPRESEERMYLED